MPRLPVSSKNPILTIAAMLVVPLSLSSCAVSESAPPDSDVEVDESSVVAGGKLAFPTAEGFGRFTVGGRGGKVIEVTNLNDSGPGSLRAAVLDPAPRTVIFRVSGTIQLASKLAIRSPFITIAGQTAPGDGICVAGNMLEIAADEVIIRHLRLRPGDGSGAELDALSARGRKNLILDHISASWGNDEVLSVYNNDAVTVQWSIVSESLYDSTHSKGPHGMGGIWSGPRASFHHNLLAHHASRNPRFAQGLTDFRNNVIYNAGYQSAYGGEGGQINMFANYFKAGPATQARVRQRIVSPSPEGTWFIEGNFVSGSPSISADNWAGGVQGTFSEEAIRARAAFAVEPVRTQSAEEAFAAVLRHAGASRPRRDAIDARIVDEVARGTATYGGNFAGPRTGIIDTQRTVGAWPLLRSQPAPADRDHDGMPDAWERAHGLNADDAADRNGYTLDPRSRNYTNLEVYLNSLVDEHPSANMSATRKIVGDGSGKCLDVRGASAGNGAAVVQYRCSGAGNQQWFLLPFGDGTYTIVARHSGKCLDVSGASSADGAPIQQWACHGGENQRWIVESDAGVTRLRSKSSNKCLDVPAGNVADNVRLQQYACHAGRNQRFSLTE